MRKRPGSGSFDSTQRFGFEHLLSRPTKDPRRQDLHESIHTGFNTMIELFKRISTIALVVGIVALGTARPARANLQIQLSTNGTSWTTVASAASGMSASFSSSSWSTSGIKISTLAMDSNSPGDPGIAFLDGSTTSLTNTTSTTRTHYIKLGDTGWTGPTVGPGFLLFDSFIGGSVKDLGVMGNNRLVFQSYVDPGNGQNSIGGPPILTTGVQSPGVASPGSYRDDASKNLYHLSGPYSITEYLEVTLGRKASINFSSTTSLTLLPEPSSLAIAGLGALGLVGYGFRRRKGD